ncbi:MAG: purine-nucleoside phosphorylase, partial [Polaromonas sp.]|nr:purine-nucleoside phosphorylase [Polaromonas sp.]
MSDLAALRTIERRAPLAHPRIAVVLGTGWGDLTDHVQDAVCIPYSELEGFPKETIAG